MNTQKLRNLLGQIDREKNPVTKIQLLSTLKEEVDILIKTLAKKL